MADGEDTILKGLERRKGFSQEPESEGNPFDAIGSFVQSGFEGTLEVFGRDPSREVERFRAENPIAGMASQLVGFGVPFVGQYQAATRIPSLARQVERMEDLASGPIGKELARETAIFAPLEVGRAGISATAGDKTFEEAIKDSALSASIGLGAAGTIGVFRKAGRTVESAEGFLDSSNPIQQNIRQLDEQIRTGKTLDGKPLDEDQLTRIKDAKTQLRQAVRLQEGSRRIATDEKTGEREAVFDFVSDLGEKEGTRQINRLFRQGNRLVRGPEDFKSNAEARSVLKNAGVPEGIESHVKFPRFVPLSTKSGKAAIKKAKSKQAGIRQHLERIDDDTFIGRETDDGLYVVAKRTRVGEGQQVQFNEVAEGRVAIQQGGRNVGGIRQEGKKWTLSIGGKARSKNSLKEAKEEAQKQLESSTANEGFLLTKTDKPELFAPQQAKWTERTVDSTAWQRDMVDKFGQSALLDMNLGTVGKVSGVTSSREARNVLVNQIAKTAEKHVAPRQFQLPGSPLARSVLMAMEGSFDLAATRARRLAFGAREVDPEKNELAQFVLGKLKLSGEDSVQGFAQRVDEDEIEGTISRILEDEIPLQSVDDTEESVAKMLDRGDISQEGFDLMEAMQRISDTVDEDEILPLQQLTGFNKYRQRRGHYGVPRQRRGDSRVKITDEDGETVALIGGKSHGEAKAIADRVIKSALDEEGVALQRSEPFTREASIDKILLDEYGAHARMETEAASVARRLINRETRRVKGSRTFRPRGNVAGFERTFSRDDMVEAFANHLDVKLRYAASMASRHTIEQYSDKIRAISGMNAFDIIHRRLQDFEGTPGKIAEATNEVVDKALGPVLGKNSATRIASTANKFYMHMTLGSLSIAYPAINSLTFMQTVLPHISMVQNAPPALLAKYYGSTIMRARDGVQGGAFLDPLKFAYQSAKQLRSQEPEWIKNVNRAANDGTIDPRFIEDYVGENAQKFLDLRKNAKSPAGYARLLKGISLLGMETGERLSRVHAFSNGFLVGRDFLKLEGEDLYLFAKKFTDNTMFRYATPDRPTLFAGPVGSTFGLFKNWMMHYTFQMLEHGNMIARNPTQMAAWKPLLWQVGGTTSVGGVGAWPFLELMDTFSKFTSDENIMQTVYGNFNLEGEDGDSTMLSDAIYYGLPGFLGLSLTAQAQMPFHAPLRDMEFMFTPVHLDRAQALFRAIGDSVDRFTATGQFNPLKSQQLSLEWARAVAPKTAYRTMQVQADSSVRSARSGQPLVKELNTLERIGFAFGMTPPKVNRMFDVADELWQDQQKRREMVGALGQEWKEAQTAGDYKAVANVLRKAAERGIDPSRVVRSAQSRLVREEKDLLEHQFSREEILKFRPVLE